MLILLFDFIGYLSCFCGLLVCFGVMDCWLVDYYWLDVYVSIEVFVSQVFDGLVEELDWLIGYFFGGLVGYEMVCQLLVSCLLMIDSYLFWLVLWWMLLSE